MNFTQLSFSTHRIAWSRAALISAFAYALIVPVPAIVGPVLLDLFELLGFGLLIVAALGRVWCLSFIAGVKNEVFGESYARYRSTTPRWIPRRSNYREPESWAINPRKFRAGLLDAMWFLWAFMLWEIFEEFSIMAWLR